MKKMLMAVCSCALTLSIAATPALAANSNSTCPKQGPNLSNSQFVRTLFSFGGQNGDQAEGTPINSLISQLLNGNSGNSFNLNDFVSTSFDWSKFFTNSCPTDTNSDDAGKNCGLPNCPSDSESCNVTSCSSDGSTCDVSSCDESSSSSEESSSSDSSSSEASSSEPSSSSSDASSSQADDEIDSAYRDLQKQVIAIVNEERAANGLSALKENAELAKVATLKSEDMAKLNYFSHTSPTYGSPFEMLSQFGITYTAAGENIAMGQPTPESVMNAWMNSEGHRANILNSSYTEIGVGIAKNANGQYIWTQTFLRP